MAARHPASRDRIVQCSVFTATRRSAVYALALASNNRADSMRRFLLFPSLWETALTQLFLELTVKTCVTAALCGRNKASETELMVCFVSVPLRPSGGFTV